MPAELEELLVADAGAWRTWLAVHHADSPGVWLILAKKGAAAATTVTYDEALEEALCQGWIDGQVSRRDASSYRQRFTPRRARSAWSQRNVGIAERLLAEGRVQAAGLEAIESARADGRWQAAYAGPAKIEVPQDLLAALAAEPRAQEMFSILTSQNRFAILYRLQVTRTPQARARRIESFVAMLARGETVHPQRRRLAQRG